MRKIKLKDKQFGFGRRLEMQEDMTYAGDGIPAPIRFDDIDAAVCDLFDKGLPIADEDGRLCPTYRFLSSQRFSDVMQVARNADRDGNLTGSFKAVSRTLNPSWGSIHGGAYNIPREGRFTASVKDVVNDKGEECYEVVTVSQPISVDVKYSLIFVTTKVRLVNSFVLGINRLFQSRQCYVCVMGCYMPIVIDQIDDESSYEVDDFRYYKSTVSFTVNGYVTPDDDAEVRLVPKRRLVDTNIGRLDRNYASVDYEDDVAARINVVIAPMRRKASFEAPESMMVSVRSAVNANNVRVFVNGDSFSSSDLISIEEGDEVVVSVAKPDRQLASSVVLAVEKA